jgi:hypothetical protein
MKIIFDRSAFHRERFDLLKSSRLLQLVQERKILVYHTAVFLDETLRTASSTKQVAKDELRRQWPFLASICNGGWFKPLLFAQPAYVKSVCDEELERREKDDGWLLVPSANRSSIEAILNKVFEDSRPLPEMDKWRPVWDKMEQIKNANRGLLIDLRNDRTARKDQTFAEYYLSLADKAATDLIHQQLAPAQPQTILDAWRRDPALYPHFTAYLEASIYGLPVAAEPKTALRRSVL